MASRPVPTHPGQPARARATTPLLLRGRYVLTNAARGAAGVLTDAAILVAGDTIVETGAWRALRRRHPHAKVLGDGTQLLMPGLVDAHSHGRALSPIQKGVLNDYLENNLFDWAVMPPFDPELTAALGVVRHVRSGCTTLHHMGFDTDGPDAADLCERAIRTYLAGGIRLAFAPGVRNVDKLVLDSHAFLETLPADLRAGAEPLVHLDGEAIEKQYFELFDHLHGKYDSPDTRILLSPSWAQACTERFLLRARDTAERLGRVPIHMHCLQTPIQKAFSLRRYGKTAIAWLDERGLIDAHVALGHAIWVTERDVEILAARGATVTTHPSCNLGMRNGLAPIYEMARRGVNVALGMDDKTINDDEDAVMELRMLHKLHRVPSYDLRTRPLDAYEVIGMGTLNGARALGFAGRIGALEPGRKADAILVDLDRVLDDPWCSPELPIAEAFLHRALGRDVSTVVIGGTVVMEDRRFRTIDVESLYREIRGAARPIGAAQRRRAELLQRLKPYAQAWYNAWLDGAPEPFYVLNGRG
jgi:cytosine/adenosine deaminase-related metal-dependent hydrolase